MRTITVSTRNGNKSVQTDLTTSEAFQVLQGNTSEFAQSLSTSYTRGRLSISQENWLLVLAQESIDRANAKPAPVAQLGNLDGINALFATAGAHLKYPKIRLALADGSTVQLSRRRQGGINVSNGEKYGSSDNVYYGRIEESGAFNSRNPNPEVIALLERFADDPAKVAAEYGRLTGNCSFCSRELTDERSTSVGYGPICANHYGLPWGAHQHVLKIA